MVTTQSTQETLTDLLPGEDTETPLLQLRLRALTPLYLGGFHVPHEDPHTLKPALEPDEQSASLRGAVRWWLRALLGRITEVNGYPMTVEDLFMLESAVLGSTDWSPCVRLSLRLKKGARDPSRPETEFTSNDSYSYVGWPFRQTRHKPSADPRLDRQPEGGRKHWPVGTSVVVTVDRADFESTAPEALALGAAIWCWANLGAIGARGRRGFGALHLEEAKNDLAESYLNQSRALLAAQPDREPRQNASVQWTPPRNVDAWITFLNDGLDAAFAAVEHLARSMGMHPRSIAPSAQPEWPSFAPGRARLLLAAVPAAETQRTKEAGALASLAAHLRAFRSPGKNPNVRNFGPSFDFPAVQKAKGPTPPARITLEHVEFGLPWVWDRIGTVEPSTVDAASGAAIGEPPQRQGRRGSPLLVRPVALTPTEFGLLFLVFDSRFLAPSAAGIRMIGVGAKPSFLTEVDIPAASYPKLDAFLAWISDPTKSRLTPLFTRSL